MQMVRFAAFPRNAVHIGAAQPSARDRHTGLLLHLARRGGFHRVIGRLHVAARK